MFAKLQNLISEAGPEVVLEVTEQGLAYSRPGEGKVGSVAEFTAFEPQTLRVSPVEENIVRPEAFLRAVREAAGPENPRRKKRAALLVPDYAVRMAVLDFDQFPDDPSEQLSLVRFRMKKSVPFDADAAAVSYFSHKRGNRIDVVVVMGAMEILGKYEAPLARCGVAPGHGDAFVAGGLGTVARDRLPDAGSVNGQHVDGGGDGRWQAAVDPVRGRCRGWGCGGYCVSYADVPARGMATAATVDSFVRA